MVTDSPSARPGPLLDAAREAQGNGDWAEALKLWRAARTAAPDRPSAYEGEADCLVALGHGEEADALLAEAVTRFPDNLPLAVRSAEFAQSRGVEGLAVQRWQALAQHFADRPAAALRAAAGLSDAGRFTDSDTLLAAAGERFPKNFEVATAAARLAERRGDWGEAMQRWEAAGQRFPHHPEIDAAIEAARARRDTAPLRRDTAPAGAPPAPATSPRIAGGPLKETIRLMLDRGEDDGGPRVAYSYPGGQRRPQGLVARLLRLFGVRAQPGSR